MKPKLIAATAMLLILTALGPHPALAKDSLGLNVYYLERPPYYWTDNGEPRGFLLDLTRRILDRAGVNATLTACPPNRIMEEIRSNASPLGSIGWFRNPERESFASFSLPIYRDRPLVVLTTRGNAARIGRHGTLESLFRDHDLIMAQVAAFSYGQTVDRLQRDILVRTMTISTTQSVLPRLIAEGRASYMLIAPEEIPTLLASAAVDPAGFVEVSMDDIPAGNLRYLIFSRSVPGDVLQRIDAAIDSLVNQKALQTQPNP